MADIPSYPGQVEKTVFPTLVPIEAFVVIWLRGFDASALSLALSMK